MLVRAFGSSTVIDRGEVEVMLREKIRVQGNSIKNTVVQIGVVVHKTSLLVPVLAVEAELPGEQRGDCFAGYGYCQSSDGRGQLQSFQLRAQLPREFLKRQSRFFKRYRQGLFVMVFKREFQHELAATMS